MDTLDPAALNALFASGNYKACKKGYAALLTACDMGGEPDATHTLARAVCAAYTNIAACNVQLGKVLSPSLGALSHAHAPTHGTWFSVSVFFDVL